MALCLLQASGRSDFNGTVIQTKHHLVYHILRYRVYTDKFTIDIQVPSIVCFIVLHCNRLCCTRPEYVDEVMDVLQVYSNGTKCELDQGDWRGICRSVAVTKEHRRELHRIVCRADTR